LLPALLRGRALAVEYWTGGDGLRDAAAAAWSAVAVRMSSQ